MNILWMHIPPHTPWGWAFEIGVAIGILWIVGFGIVLVVGSLLNNWDPPSYQSRALQQQHPASRAIALREQQESARARLAIDDIYRRSEEEVRRLGS
jgi:hypothetical protein